MSAFLAGLIRSSALVCNVKYTIMAFYAVARGKSPGIYRTWPECQESVGGFRGAKFKKFLSEREALAYLQEHGVKQPTSETSCAASNDDSDIEVLETVPKKAIQFLETKDIFPTKPRQSCTETCESLPQHESGSLTGLPRACKSSMEIPDRSFDFASFAQRLSNLENLYQQKVSDLENLYQHKVSNLENLFKQRIRTVEERVEALEAAKVLDGCGDLGEDFSNASRPVSNKASAIGVHNPQNSVTSSAVLSSSHQIPTSSLQRKLHTLASNPVPLGRKRISLIDSMKRAGGSPPCDEAPPQKIPALQHNDDTVATLSKVFHVPFRVDSDGYVEVFTDGACTNNGRCQAKAGIGVWFNDGHPLNISEPVRGRATNNTAEIQAATRAIKEAALVGIKKLCVFTDSMFTINCMTNWVKRWKKNDWKTTSGEPVINKEDLIELDKACSGLGITVKWTHVRGHRGVHGNECADRLAIAGAEKYRVIKVNSAV